MPNINVSTNYAGEVLDNILAKAALGNEITEKGVIHVVPGIKKKFSIPRMQVNGTLLQARKARIATDGTVCRKHELKDSDRALRSQLSPRWRISL